ncbi:MAG: hypothetical protein MUC61_03770 [Amoebophilaceae bacterium]|jgi:hypothetical protein|nr:hypothetical protein [Amoebophilaceae bacterium]
MEEGELALHGTADLLEMPLKQGKEKTFLDLRYNTPTHIKNKSITPALVPEVAAKSHTSPRTTQFTDTKRTC